MLDFKVEIPLAQEQWMHLHTVRDPVGAAFQGAELYVVKKRKSRVTLEQAQTTLRHSFAAHGVPEEVQTDWEAALHGQAGDPFPPRFTLWLVGLGIEHVHGRPGIPTDEAEVERAHRTLFDYALADHLDLPFLSLVERVRTAVAELNGEYPSRAHGCAGQPPIVAHPELLHPPRPFDPHQELARFDLHRVDAYLATFTFPRKVGKTGQVTLGGQHETYSVGRDWAGKIVTLRFDPLDRCFFAYPPQHPEQEIRRWPAKHLAVADLVGFSTETVCPLPQQLALPLVFSQVVGNEFLQV
jgi:hypothetical protein